VKKSRNPRSRALRRWANAGFERRTASIPESRASKQIVQYKQGSRAILSVNSLGASFLIQWRMYSRNPCRTYLYHWLGVFGWVKQPVSAATRSQEERASSAVYRERNLYKSGSPRVFHLCHGLVQPGTLPSDRIRLGVVISVPTAQDCDVRSLEAHLRARSTLGKGQKRRPMSAR
jgi:hypothetical protein